MNDESDEESKDTKDVNVELTFTINILKVNDQDKHCIEVSLTQSKSKYLMK
jgi:hypothetical protein